MGSQEWYLASELTLVMLAFVLTFIMLSGQNIGRLNPLSGDPPSVSSGTSGQAALRVVGEGSEAPRESGTALQGATPVQQSGQSGKNLQQSASGNNQLQPNQGGSGLPQKQPLQ
jgi:hypothetical protein